ncbi:MAG: lyase family protein [Spirochaetales bacterium]|uniref:Lyase family protein n=1 Tax=Candidatus Thalassospirochaeta sargassi TaxID=3119039 RepID=A0AAJ1IDA7_9SPIO|nr:lyase family protein [Spirochaetales bacterium]
MEDKSIFRNISPLDHRYYLSNKAVFDDLADYISEEASIMYCIKAEAALLKSHMSLQGDKYSGLFDEVDKLSNSIKPEEVYAEEEKTQHNIRALVNVMKSKVPDELKPFIHLGATSVDILDTASSMKYRDAVRNVILPQLIILENQLAEIAGNEAYTPQVGRTHGQHAVPITLGFALSEYVSRLGKSIIEIERLSKNLRGKLAGAVGSYNSTSMIVKDPFALEEKYLDYLGLEASEHSTQMVEPEYLLRLLTEINTAFGVLANLADDLRNLQRSEISELREMFTATQVGSSTMPQKRNPWNSEHVKSLWKAFSPRVVTFFMDQISEHQRDLSNSASTRFIADYLAGFTAAVARMIKITATLYVDKDRLKANLSFTGDLVLAEAAYILLSCAGEPDAHEVIRKVTLKCEENNSTLAVELPKDPQTWKLISDQLMDTAAIDALEFFSKPELYRGKAAEKAEIISAKYKNSMKKLEEILKK